MILFVFFYYLFDFSFTIIELQHIGSSAVLAIFLFPLWYQYKLLKLISFLVLFFCIFSVSLISTDLIFAHASIPYVRVVIRQVTYNLGLTVISSFSTWLFAPIGFIFLLITSNFLAITVMCSSRFPSLFILIPKYWYVSVFHTVLNLHFLVLSCIVSYPLLTIMYFVFFKPILHFQRLVGVKN